MAATGTPTPNIGLRIPLGTDPASVDDINYNSNLIDTKLGAVGNDSVQDQIDDLNSKLTTLNPSTLYRPLSENQTSPWTYISPHDGVLYLTFVGTARSYIGIQWNGAYLCGVAMPDTSGSPLAQTVTIFVRKNDEIYVPGLSSTCYLIASQTTLIARGADI